MVGRKPSGIVLLNYVSVAPQSWRGAHSWCVWATLWRRVLDSTKKAFFGRDETGNFLSHIFKLNSWKNNSNRLMTENCTVSSSSWGDRSGFQSECFTLCGCQVAVPLCPVDIPPACKHSKQGSITNMHCRRSIWNPSFKFKIQLKKDFGIFLYGFDSLIFWNTSSTYCQFEEQRQISPVSS